MRSHLDENGAAEKGHDYLRSGQVLEKAEARCSVKRSSVEIAANVLVGDDIEEV